MRFLLVDVFQRRILLRKMKYMLQKIYIIVSMLATNFALEKHLRENHEQNWVITTTYIYLMVMGASPTEIPVEFLITTPEEFQWLLGQQ